MGVSVRPAASTQVTQATQAHEPSFPELIAMGNDLVRTGFLPDHIKTGAQAAAIILTGRELGMLPMRALRSLSLVKGKVTESADSQLARFKTDGGRAQFTELSETRAILHLRHPNGDEHAETFTFADAKTAGLTAQGGMYSKYPKAMLRSRAITAGLKSIGWEGGAGTYDPDELSPMGVATATAHIPDAVVTLPEAERITDAQHALLTHLMRLSVFTERERERIVEGATTQAAAVVAINWARERIAKRAAEQVAQAGGAAEPVSRVVGEDDDRDDSQSEGGI